MSNTATDRHTAIPETWICTTCKHAFHIEASYAVTLVEHGCAFCGSHSFSLYDLRKELEAC